MATTSKPSSDRALLQRRIRVARGEEAGDLLITGAQVVNVFTCRVEPANVVIADGYVAGVGPYEWTARETISAKGQFILPGLIDGHMHLESTLLAPAEFARVVVPHGTSAVVADPHEVGNVLGVRGIEMLLAASAGLPLEVFFMAPSCVPCTSWEHAGATLDAAEVDRLLANDRVLGLAEMMDFPAVLAGNEAVLDKVLAAEHRHRAVDGHAPALSGRELVAYVAAGIRSDHESTSIDEALAKAALGVMVQVRDGSTARNLDTLMPLLVEDRLGDWCFSTDDIYPNDLVRDGHIDGFLRRVVAAGVPAAQAVRHASLVPAVHYGLSELGAVGPGYRANLLVTDDLIRFAPRLVVHHGKVVARDGQYLHDAPPPAIPDENTVHIAPLSEKDFELRLSSDEAAVIGIIPNQINTNHLKLLVKRDNGRFVHTPDIDVALVASIERHKARGQVGLGLVQGFNFRQSGALGSSVAHDSHNLVISGTNAADMLVCARELERIGGGFVAASGGKVLATLPLPVAGLLSRAPAETLVQQLGEVHAAAKQLGCHLESPFATLSFLALSVIPELRITDQGVFDVMAQKFVTL